MTFQQTAMRVAKQGEFALRKNAPSIMTYVGVGGFIATVGLAIRATSKADEIAPKIREEIQNVKDENQITESMTKKEASERLARAYVNAGKQLVKIYAPTLTTGSVSIIFVLAGHGLMLRRQARLAAIYAALDASYKAYRARVREELGAEKEDYIYRRPNMRALDQDENGEDGDGSDTSQIDLGTVLPSPYARFFDPTSPNWVKTPEYNMLFLRAQEKWANDRLTMYGYLFLNEVYEALGLERSQFGQVVGWKLNKNGESAGDGFVSFGIGDIFDESSRAFVNGLENIVLLDFNVDGVIRI